MKKIITVPIIFLCFTFFTYGQKPVLTKKDSRKILEKAWNCIKTNDTAGFIKLWVMDNTQWPYHTVPFDVQQIKINFLDFKSYFDSALVKNLKFDEVQSDTIENIDPHYYYAKYFIKAWFKYSKNHRGGFGFYLDYINKEWMIRFSPDYSDVYSSGK